MKKARKWLSLLLALALVFTCLPQMTLPAQAAEEYDIWVGGVRVDSSNAGDVLGDGAVVFTPASGSEPAKLTLNSASITGAFRPDRTDSTAGIYTEEDLTLELHGASAVNGTDADASSYGILINGYRLTVTGDGILDVTAGDSDYSCAISTNSMIIRSGTIRATAGKASGVSQGVYSNSFTMEGGALVATGGEAPKSWGVDGSAAINGGVVIAGGQARAFWGEPDLSGYADPDVRVIRYNPEFGALAWNGKDALGGDGSSFHYVGIEPAGYDVWVGGVRVTEENKDDVMGDGAVVFTPATESEDGKLTLNNANISGSPVPYLPTGSFGILSTIDLTLEIQGVSTVASDDAADDSFGILFSWCAVTIVGSGTLDVTAGDGSYSCAICTDTMTMRSGTVRATAGKASESEGVYSNSFTMEGGTLVATGGEAPNSWGVSGNAAINGGTVVAIGQTRAFDYEPDLSGYADPDVRVNTEADYPQYAEAWNGTDDLGDDGSSFQCVIIEPAGYDLWVGGVRVTDDNKADVLGDGTVAFTPATESEQAKLTLNNADISGAPVPAWPHDSDGIYSDIDLTLELHGKNTITADNAWEDGDSIGIFTGDCSLIVTGDGILNVTTGEGRLSCGVCSFVMTMRSGTLRVTAGKATEDSDGVYSLSFTMEGGTLITEAGEAPNSRGFDCISTFNGGTIVATGQTSALFAAPKFSDDGDPAVLVNTEPTEIGATAWNGTDALGGDGSSFKYLRIEPAGYDLWVGGVRVTEANKADVLGDGTVAFTPATESEQAKLTLNGAKITGALRPYQTDSTVGVYAKMDLTLELAGSNEIIGTDALDVSYGVLVSDSKLTVIGGGTLDVSAGDGFANCGIGAKSMIMRSGTIRATAGKASYESDAVFTSNFTMEGGTLIAEGGESSISLGLFVSAPIINGGTVVAIGQTCAFYGEPDLSGYADPDVRVNTATSATSAKAWNGTDDLGEDGSFKCVIIEPAGYDLWVGGVRVTEANKADVLGDGTVAFTPATESEQAKLTLNNADISGAPVPAWPHNSDGIYSDIDLTMELHGENTVTANDAWEGGDSLGIFAGYCSLIVTGDGILNVTTGESRLSCGVDTSIMTMRSGTLRATAGKATSVSDGVYSLYFTMEGGTLIAEAGEAPESWGFVGQATINGGTIEATGQRSAFYREPDLSGYADPDVRVNTATSATGATAWNGTDALGGDGSSFKYVRISRKADPTPPELENPFIDVKKGTYYYDAVLWAVNAKPQVTSGTSYDTFSPNATCTRAQVVTFLWRAKGCPEPEMDAAASPFADVREGSYYFKAVLWAVENKITKGTSETTFSPDQGCTRGQVVTFLHRFAGTPAPGSDVNPFGDVKKGAFYYDAVLWAVEKNVTKGTTATTFSPNDTCTRGQIVTFLYRAMKS